MMKFIIFLNYLKLNKKFSVINLPILIIKIPFLEIKKTYVRLRIILYLPVELLFYSNCDRFQNTDIITLVKYL